MSRTPRAISSSDIYHVISRGAGRRILFEDDDDRLFFLEKLYEYKDENDVGVLAWCFMENHIHLLLRCPIENLTSMMRSLNTSFARYYNGRHAHVGPVFQDRYKSFPVENDPYFMEIVRYIHLNSQNANVSRFDAYEWSSYRNFFSEESLCDTAYVLGVFGGREPFVKFHRNVASDQDILELVADEGESTIRRSVISDGEARELARNMFGDEFASELASKPKTQRDSALRRLKCCGLSVRQIERLTGIGRGIIQKC